MEIGYGLFDGFIRGSGIAPPKSCPIIGAHSCMLSDSGLHESPIDRVCVSTGHQNDRWVSVTGAIKMQFAPIYVNQPARRWVQLRSGRLGMQIERGDEPD